MTRTPALLWAAAISASALEPATAAVAQTVGPHMAALGDGTIRLSFAARPGVCGGASEGNITIVDSGRRGEWESGCTGGPVRMSLGVRAGRLASAHVYIGGRWRPAGLGTTDLGTLPARETAAELLALAERSPAGDTDALVTAAALADSAVVWPELLRLARSHTAPIETRRRAVFWLGQAAGEAAGRGLDSLTTEPDADLEIRKQAVFALSQRPGDEGVPALIRIARANPHPALRKAALFWLGESDDPRALALFEELLQ